ncbi:hypothetical protein [Nocardia sp. NPDC005998]|uniref:hypothetical protein n=1 Tax=Nocardia sp. NPDC005998 TaxID=3156894 RepID=UPI0033AADC06
MSWRTGRSNDELRGLDVPAALVAGMPEPGPARRILFAEAAIAASLAVQDLGVGPHPVRFLAGCVRSLGLDGALQLPEPLIGDQPTRLVREWMSAAHTGPDPDIARDDLFARWLEAVALLIEVRQQALHPGQPGDRGGGAPSEGG